MDSVKEQLGKNGFAVIENFYTEEECELMKAEMSRIVEGIDFDKQPKSVFSTYDEDKHAADDYFLNSSDKIRVFFEEGALDKKGNLLVDKQRALNKVGHGLHWLNPVFKKLSFCDRMKELMRAIDYKQPQLVQGMYIFKQPRIGGPVTDHIDATFLQALPRNHLVGVWVAVDDSTPDNGCLSFIPGSHKYTDVGYRFVRTHDTTGGSLLKFIGDKPVYPQDQWVQVPIHRGSLIVIDGLVVHKSEANTSERSRHAYTMHILERHETEWSKDNWLQETDTYKFPNLYDN